MSVAPCFIPLFFMWIGHAGLIHGLILHDFSESNVLDLPFDGYCFDLPVVKMNKIQEKSLKHYIIILYITFVMDLRVNYRGISKHYAVRFQWPREGGHYKSLSLSDVLKYCRLR